MATAHDGRFEPHERPPHVLAAGLGAQMVVLIVTGIMVTPLVVARAAELPAGTASWLVFTALIASGIATWLQVGRIGRIGGGYVLFVGSNVATVSVSVSAIQWQGGVPLLATLVCVASLATFLFTKKAMDQVEREVIAYVLQKTAWNRSKATKILKISYKTLLYKIKELGIQPPPDAFE